MNKKSLFLFASLLLAAGLLFFIATRPRPARFELVKNYSVPGTVAEIVAASPDGKTLVYTDSEARKLGWVDISDPAKPRQLGSLDVKYEPTSVAVTPDGKWALAVVNDAPGRMYVVDMKTRRTQRIMEFPGQPDSIAISRDGRYAAIAVENERDDEELPMPQTPAGYLLIADLAGAPAAWSTRRVNFTGLPIRFPADPEPEFIAINDKNEAAVTLQENNAISIVQLADGKIVETWDCGKVSHAADLKADNRAALTEQLTDARREPDAIAWTPGGNLIVANEGDYSNDLKESKGEYVGGRNWTIFSRNGKVIFDSGDELEREAIQAGVYDDDRSPKRGVEPEGVSIMQAQDGRSTLAFIGCEYGSGAAMYDLSDETRPRFLQWLQGGASPEGIIAVAQRNLFIAANEGDGTISIFQKK